MRSSTHNREKTRSPIHPWSRAVRSAASISSQEKPASSKRSFASHSDSGLWRRDRTSVVVALLVVCVASLRRGERGAKRRLLADRRLETGGKLGVLLEGLGTIPNPLTEALAPE